MSLIIKVSGGPDHVKKIGCNLNVQELGRTILIPVHCYKGQVIWKNKSTSSDTELREIYRMFKLKERQF